MNLAVNIIDTNTSGKETKKFKLRLVSETMTVEELISRRVRAEVKKFNKEPDTHFLGLVPPTWAEKSLNSRKTKKSFPKMDAEKQVATAIESFKRNGFFLFVDNEQYENKDDNVTLTHNSTVEFIRLVQLTGG